MSDQNGLEPGRWSMPSLRRIADFFLTIGQLERSYQSLKAENDKLSKRVAELETTSGDHTGQLKVLAAFVQGALDKEVERKAEQAAARHIEKLIAQRSSHQRTIARSKSNPKCHDTTSRAASRPSACVASAS